jgi:hypothetical protein
LASRALHHGALVALVLAVMTTAPAALGQPAPDPAPTSPTVAPDPAPGASAAPPSSSPPSSEEPAPQAPATSVPTAPAPASEQPSPAVDERTSGSEKASAKQTRSGSKPKHPKPEEAGSPQLPRRITPNAAFLGVDALLPRTDVSDDSSSTMLLLAAGGLIALVMASGSFAFVLARLMPPTAVLLLALVVLVAPAPARAETITAHCNTVGAADNCDGWYSASSVSLIWAPDPLSGAIIEQGCVNGTFTSEAAQFTRTCRIKWGTTTVIKSIWIGVDRTDPQITGLQTARAPDYDGWFNHPVALTFKASDALSGVANCTALTYSGPDGASAPVDGGCTDVAGNSDGATLALNYDATAPPAPEVTTTPGDRAVQLEWTTTSGVQAEVTRFSDGQSEVVYRGTGNSYTDRAVRNEQRYRYVATLIDQAGNRASGEAGAVPTASPLLTPSAQAKLTAAPLLTWRKVRRASYYNVQLFRGTRKILSRWPRANQLQLKHRWRYAGKTRRLVAGRYCWYVWPGYGARKKRDYGHMLGKRCFRIVR